MIGLLKAVLLAIGVPRVAGRAASDVRLIVTEGQEAVWMAEEEILALSSRRIGFLDITFNDGLYNDMLFSHLVEPPKGGAIALPTSLAAGRAAEVERLIAGIDSEAMRDNLAALSSFSTRYYKSPSGEAAAEWIHRRITEIVAGSPLTVTVERITHPRWGQASIRCRVTDPTMEPRPNERILLTAHLDSISLPLPLAMLSPGADDDGSGVVVQLEVLRLVTQGGGAAAIRLSREVEFVFFSAEEVGLLGSQAIASSYRRAGVHVALLHIDMAGYHVPGREATLGLIMDNTDVAMNGLLKGLISKYASIPVAETACGYACSDHYSWHHAGYQAAMLTEGLFEDINPRLHSPADTIAVLDFGHLSEFVKVSLAYALHMTDPAEEAHL